MTSYDRQLIDLAARIDRLASRTQSAFFLSCAMALRGQYDDWAAAAGVTPSEALNRALRLAHDYALGSPVSSDASSLLDELAAATPPGEAIGDLDSTAAQDAWICGDAAVRVIAEPETQPGMWVEYALQPRIRAVTEQLHGFAELGSGDDDLMDEVVSHPRVVEATQFCDWAITFLAHEPHVSAADLDRLTERAAALVP